VRSDVKGLPMGMTNDGARAVHVTRGNVLMGGQMDFLVGSGDERHE
jgi:hypothetical protein